MSLFSQKYSEAMAYAKKYSELPRAGWVEKGSRAKINQAIMVPRVEAVKLAEALASATHGNFSRLYEIMALKSYMSKLAAGNSSAMTCKRCFGTYLPEWMDGKCLYCEAESEARRNVEEALAAPDSSRCEHGATLSEEQKNEKPLPEPPKEVGQDERQRSA